MPTARRAGSVRYNTKLRAPNVNRKKPPVQILVENLSALRRKHRQSLCENKALAKSLAAAKQELTEQCELMKHKREIFSIHLPRVRRWVQESSKALQTVMTNHINAVNLLSQILDPDGRPSFTPQESSAPEELPDRTELCPPGSHLQANASVIYEEEEEEEPEKTEELPVHFVQQRLDYVTRRNARTEEKSLRDRCSSPLTQLPDKTGSTDDLNLQTTRFMMSAESLLDMLQAVPTASTPVCSPEVSPRRRSARRRSSTVAGMPLLTASMFNRRRSEKVPQMSPTRPGPSRSPQHPSIPGDGSSRARTSPGVERPSSRQDSRDNPHGAWLESSVGRMRRRASQAVSYKEPKINSKLRRP